MELVASLVCAPGNTCSHVYLSLTFLALYQFRVCSFEPSYLYDTLASLEVSTSTLHFPPLGHIHPN